jgi:hypothetical protein
MSSTVGAWASSQAAATGAGAAPRAAGCVEDGRGQQKEVFRPEGRAEREERSERQPVDPARGEEQLVGAAR